MNNQMDKILAGFAKWDLDDNRLKHLESDVWQRIAYERQEQPVGMLEGFLATIFPAQYRFAPVMGAALLGIMLGFGTLPFAAPSPDAAEMLNFKVFKPQLSGLNSITLASEHL